MSAKHTPTPWTSDRYKTRDDTGPYWTSEILDGRGRCIVEFSNSSVPRIERDDDCSWDDQAKADAAFIVEACNSHAGLVSALSQLVEAAQNIETGRGVHNDRRPEDRIEGAVWSVLSDCTRHARLILAALRKA